MLVTDVPLLPLFRPLQVARQLRASPEPLLVAAPWLPGTASSKPNSHSSTYPGQPYASPSVAVPAPSSVGMFPGALAPIGEAPEKNSLRVRILRGQRKPMPEQTAGIAWDTCPLHLPPVVLAGFSAVQGVHTITMKFLESIEGPGPCPASSQE